MSAPSGSASRRLSFEVQEGSAMRAHELFENAPSMSCDPTPAATPAPTSAPTLVPVTTPIGTCSLSSTDSTPRCAAPRTAPPPPARPTTAGGFGSVSYTHLRAHETRHDLVCRL